MKNKTQAEQTCQDVAKRLHISEEEVEKLLEMNKNLAQKYNNNGYQGALISIGWIAIEKRLQTVKLNRGASPTTCCYLPVKKAMIRAMKREKRYKNTEKTNSKFSENLPDDKLTPEETLIEQEQKKLLEEYTKLLYRLLKKLPKRDQKILSLCFGFKNGRKLTLKEIGKIFNISKERVRQIKERGIDTLRQQFEEQGYL